MSLCMFYKYMCAGYWNLYLKNVIHVRKNRGCFQPVINTGLATAAKKATVTNCESYFARNEGGRERGRERDEEQSRGVSIFACCIVTAL